MVRYAILLVSALLALAPAKSQTPVLPTEAEYAVIMDHESGEILFSKDGEQPMVPASMTKIMTAYLVFDRLERGEVALTDTFTVSENAWRKGGWASGGSTMGLDIGDTPTVEELLRGVIVLSGNDSCIVLAEGLSGSETAFAAEMTALARELGLDSATFTNSTGLDEPDHRISAIDLARLSKLTIDRFPRFYAFYEEPDYEWRGISQPNRNPLLGRMDGVDGLKTGHLEASGYGLTASAIRDGVRRTIVINGLPSISERASEAERLMRLAFASFTTRTIAPDGVALPDLDVHLGSRRSVSVSLAEPISLTAHVRAFDRAKAEIVYEAPLEAPIKSGDVIGRLVVTVEGRPPVVGDVIADESVSRLGLLGQAAEGAAVLMSGSDG